MKPVVDSGRPFLLYTLWRSITGGDASIFSNQYSIEWIVGVNFDKKQETITALHYIIC